MNPSHEMNLFPHRKGQVQRGRALLTRQSVEGTSWN
jgi:hypothetical protein